MNEPMKGDAIVPTVSQLLQRARLALDGDAHAARREIQRALELLLDAEFRGPAPSGLAHHPVHGLAPWQARRVIDHIRAHLETPIRVEDMARTIRLSTSHFSRTFRRSFSMSPHAYVTALRLVRARELLLGSDEQMTQIAMACGFADQAHFSRVFHREMGCAPGRWRREWRGRPALPLTPGGGSHTGASTHAMPGFHASAPQPEHSAAP
jgi:transcriptional regulator GlxA family with amidase domain